jgi:alanyl-tRNA synthetase
MATKRLYYDHSFLREFTANVLSCEPVAALAAAPGTVSVDAAATPAWRVRLDRTAFYPASGGQPYDTGRLGDAMVVEVIDEADDVVHIVDRPVAPGAVNGTVDWPRRFDHMQQHSGQHLLSAVFQQNYSLPTVSFHLGAELCSIDLRGREPEQEILDGAAAAANELVYQDRAVSVQYGTVEELATAGVRKTVDRQGVLRAIAIAALELQPCGGTHVQSTGQIGTILLRGVSKIRQDWRLEFVCGRRAERLARRDFATLKAVAQKLNCAVAETAAAAERVVAEREAHFKSAKASLEKLAEWEARSAVQTAQVGADGIRVVARAFQGAAMEYAQSFAREVSKSASTVALVVRGECGSCFFAQHPAAGQDMNALLAETLQVVGGKGGGARDSARGKLADPGRSEEALEYARRRCGVVG